MKRKAILLVCVLIVFLSASAKKTVTASINRAEEILGEEKIISAEKAIAAWRKIGINVEMFADTTLPSLELMQKAAKLNLEGYNIFLIPIFDLGNSDLKRFYKNLKLYTTVKYPIGYRLINIPEKGENKNDLNDMRKSLPKNSNILESMVLYQSFATLYISNYFRSDEIILIPIPKNEFSLFTTDESQDHRTEIVCGVIIRKQKAEIIFLAFPQKFTCETISNEKITYRVNKKQKSFSESLTYLKLNLIPEDEDFYVNYAFSL
ncbi:MAG: hypothetical protein WCJ57_02825 [Candidatus Falkowbacteria bacterium]